MGIREKIERELKRADGLTPRVPPLQVQLWVTDDKIVLIRGCLVVDNDRLLSSLLDPVEPCHEVEGILLHVNPPLETQDFCRKLPDFRNLVVFDEIPQMFLHLFPEEIDLARRVLSILLFEAAMEDLFEFPQVDLSFRQDRPYFSFEGIVKDRVNK